MKRSSILLTIILFTALVAFIVPSIDMPLLKSVFNWTVITAVLAILTCLAFFFEFETAVTSSKEIALVAMLGTISAVLRVPFAAIPNVQPCTYLIICSGYVFGPIAGFAVGAITTIVSNFFLGHGPWTVYQMIAWGLAGVLAGYLGRVRSNNIALVIFGVLWGYVYGWITNLWFWTTFVYPLTLQTFVVTQINTIWFDTFHAVGNAVFMGIMGTRTVIILRRFKMRFGMESLTQHKPPDSRIISGTID